TARGHPGSPLLVADQNLLVALTLLLARQTEPIDTGRVLADLTRRTVEHAHAGPHRVAALVLEPDAARDRVGLTDHRPTLGLETELPLGTRRHLLLAVDTQQAPVVAETALIGCRTARLLVIG